MFIVAVGVPVFGGLLTMILSSFIDLEGTADSIESRATLETSPSSLSPPDDLADALSFFSRLTDIQKDDIKNSYRGKVVQWTLPVWDVSKEDDGYTIQTTSSAKVAIFCRVATESLQELAFVKELKEGDLITCKGIVSGYSLGSVNLSPAVLVN